MKCRHCGNKLEYVFVDLGFAPPSNANLTKEELLEPELYFPLKVRVCDSCWLVQTEDYTEAEKLFDKDYAYFSSTSSSWVEHAKRYSRKMIEELKLDVNSFVIEVASNDGYLLKNFINSKVPCLGVEPTDSTASEAEKIGIPVLREFFGSLLAGKLANEGRKADLIVGNNVYAHVPDINDFTLGLKRALKENGTITLEFPHLMELIKYTQFDTIYHEHFSYLSLFSVRRIFESVGLRVWNVEQLTTHGGSLRVYGCHIDDHRKTEKIVDDLVGQEKKIGMQDLGVYLEFQHKANKVKNNLLSFLIKKKEEGKRVVAYGAAAKGNTILNYAGVKCDLIDFVCDAALAKQGKYMPGSHIPIVRPEVMFNEEIDYILILPWNIANEVKTTCEGLVDQRVKFVTAVPELNII